MRATFPSRVTELEESWGEHCMKFGQTESACSHFIQAGKHQRVSNFYRNEKTKRGISEDITTNACKCPFPY